MAASAGANHINNSKVEGKSNSSLHRVPLRYPDNSLSPVKRRDAVIDILSLGLARIVKNSWNLFDLSPTSLASGVDRGLTVPARELSNPIERTNQQDLEQEDVQI